MLIVDRRKAIIGSSNLSWRGLIANHETALMLEHGEVGTLARAFDVLLGGDYVKEV